ncbi:MAG: TRAP transporter TatT component family protein [Wenzhouxiangellaceae bacterium]|nr:TRAP transporter TatT component family protein [Wenzhouxiangellaceae bacterium]
MPALTLVLTVALGGCGALIDRATVNFANDLESAVVNYDEPLIVERGLPAFLLILEARLQANPTDVDLLISLSSLTASYSGLFVERPESSRRLARKAFDYARRAACARRSALCDMASLPFEQFEQAVAGLEAGEVETTYVLATSWVSWIASASNDYAALADLPKAEILLQRISQLDPKHDDGMIWLYLAVLNSQRPPAAGGQPALARQYFQRAREVSENRNLMIDVFMADEYARLVFDRELFVELLEGVLQADPDQPGYVLANHIAQAQARQLLDQTTRIFD